MSLVANFKFDEGEDYIQPFAVVACGTTTAVNISGWTLTLTVRQHFGSTTALLTKTAVVTDGPNGLCQVTFNRADTDDWCPGVYCYDLSRTDSGLDKCLVKGYLTIGDRSR
jgi:hypothetical protein